MPSLMDNTLEKVSLLISESAANGLRKQFDRILTLTGGDKILRRIASSPDEEQIKDYLAEVRYSLVFVGLGFQVEIEPLGRKGPDLKISRNGNHAVVEITHFRKKFSGPPELCPYVADPILQIYGDPKRDVNKSRDKISSKFRQITNENTIIAIWNDDGDLEQTEVRIAVNDIQRHAYEANIPVSPNLSFILYGSDWINLSNKQQLYCFPLGKQESYIIGWQNELERSIVSRLIQRALTLSDVSLTS